MIVFLHRWIMVYWDDQGTEMWMRADRIGAVREDRGLVEVQDMGGHWWEVVQDGHATEARDVMRLICEALMRKPPARRPTQLLAEAERPTAAP